jgi:hypothetical protein
MNKYIESSLLITICVTSSSFLCGFLFYYLVENVSMKLGDYIINKISSLKIFK